MAKNVQLPKVIISFFLIFLSSYSCADSLRSYVDRAQIDHNETLNLTVIFSGTQASGAPDFSSLNQHFDILNNRNSTQRSIINGVVTGSIEWRLTLFPKSTGRLLIPPFSFQGQTSNPVTVSVNRGNNVSASGKPEVFVETNVSATEAYVQQQIIFSYKLYSSLYIQRAEAPDLNFANTRLEELPRLDYQKSINNVTYGVIEVRFALIPESSGEIVIPEHTWSVQTTSGANLGRYNMNGRSKLHRAKSEKMVITVKPKPPEYPVSKPWLPAKEVQLSDSWSNDPSNFKVGEPITRTVTLHAKGLSAEQLPPIVGASNTQDFKFYPDKPATENHNDNQGLASSRSESIAIVPARAGNLTLPEVSVTWWDVESSTVKVATLPAVEVYIEAIAPTQNQEPISYNLNPLPSSGQTAPPAQNSSSGLWKILGIVSLLVNLTLIAVLLYRPKRHKLVDTGTDTAPLKTNSVINKLAAACNNGTPKEVRTALLQLAAILWPTERTARLEAFAKRSAHPALLTQLQNLEATLYADSQKPVDYPLILQEVRALMRSGPTRESSDDLVPLYPS